MKIQKRTGIHRLKGKEKRKVLKKAKILWR